MAEKRRSFVDWIKNIIRRGRTKEEEQKTVDWLRDKLTDYSSLVSDKSASKTFKQDFLQKRSVDSLGPNTTVGRMFLFYYSAKHKATLPFWDAFPLIILLGPAKNGFLGLNMHYLPPTYRAVFFDNLLDVMTTKKLRDSSRVAITYNLLKSTSKYKYFKPALKHYLGSHIRSNIKMVPATEWHQVLFLNNAMWQKANASSVYRWSRQQYG